MSSREADEGEDIVLSAEVPPSMAGQRLDAVCAKLFYDYSRSRIQQWIEAGRLLHNGAVAQRAREPVEPGDTLELSAEAEPDESLKPQKIALKVVHEDAHLLILNKPAGLTVHPGAGQRDGTLQNALLYHYPQSAGVPRAGIVHRLDKDTTGLLCVALSLNAHAALVRALARRDIRREYDAVVQGTFVAGGSINLPMGRHPRDRLKQAVVERGGRDALTHYRVQERFGHHTHLRVKLETGRTHQIRVHFSHLRHPIVGDTLYGGETPRGKGMTVAQRQQLAFPRQALHACELELDHPVTGERLSFAAKPPKDMQTLISTLRKVDPPLGKA